MLEHENIKFYWIILDIVAFRSDTMVFLKSFEFESSNLNFIIRFR